MIESFPQLPSDAAGDFLLAATTCKSVDALESQFLDFARSIGFHSGMMVNLSSAGKAVSPNVLMGDRAPWIEHYTARNYARIDPTISQAFRSREPFTWKDVERPSAPRRQRQFFGGAREVWAKDGLIVPIHGPFGEFSVVNLLSNDRIELGREEAAVLKAVCSTYASVGLTLMNGALPAPPGPPPSLSRRESQCLFWMCLGRHDAETAKILKLSEHTVRGYLDSVRIKLEVETRPELALKALAWGLLVPDLGMMA